MNSSLYDSFQQIRQSIRIYNRDEIAFNNNDEEEEEFVEDDINEIQKKFLSLLSDFPSENIECLYGQLINFYILLRKIYCFDFPPSSLQFIKESNFHDSIFSLMMNPALDPISQFTLIIIFRYLTLNIFSPETLTIFNNELFLDRLLYFLKLEDKHPEISLECLWAIINIIQFCPNSFFFFDKSGITQYVATKMINSKEFKILCAATRYILLITQRTPDPNLKKALLNQSILKLIDTKDTHPLTFLLQTVLLCMSEDSNIRILLVEENICQKCVDIIIMMKKITKFSQYYGDYAVKILSLIANEGNEHEFQILLQSNVFEAFFNFSYSFFDISPLVHVDVDTYEYTCNFLYGIFCKATPLANQLLNQYEIIPQIINVYLKGPEKKKMCSLSIITSLVELHNMEVCQYILKNEIISAILEMLSSMSPEMLKITILLLQKILSLMPKAKDIYIQNDMIPKLESLIFQEDLGDDSYIIETLLSSVHDD